MHIREIHIENVRCFDRVDLDLTRPDGTLAGWTVLAGRNGTGKSTLLKAIALSVAGPRVSEKLQRSFLDWIRRSSTAAKARTTVVDEERNPGITLDLSLGWRVAPSGSEPFLEHEQQKESPTLGPWDPNPRGWFLAGYGPFRRLGFRDDYNEPGPPMEASLRSLFDEDATLAESIHWLKDILASRFQLDGYASEVRARHQSWKADEFERDAQERQNLYDNVLALLNDGLLPKGASVSRVDMREGLLLEQDGVVQPVRSFSDGYRAAIALIFDIVRQMHRCFEKLDVAKRTSNGRTIVQVLHEGVVLIDEVDAHLHISWQKRIGFWLKEHFPNVQFIVTTHSPFICQAADPKGLIRLPVPGSGERVEHVSNDLYNTVVCGDADDAVMTALFGIDRPHSEEAERLRSTVARLEVKHIRGLATPEERAELNRLHSLLPKTGAVLVDHAQRKLREMP